MFLREPVPKLDPRIHKSANKKLHQLDAAVSLDSLGVPPGNRLEAVSYTHLTLPTIYSV